MNLSDVPAVWLTGGGIITILTSLYWLSVTGNVAFKREINEWRERDKWQQSTITEVTNQNRDLVIAAAVAAKSLDSMREIVERGRVLKGAEAETEGGL